MKFKRTVLLLTVVVMMGLLLGASAAQAFTVVVDDTGTNATAILNLEFNGAHYDVTFRFGSIEDIWGDEAYDFHQLNLAVDASEAVNDALNTEPEVVTLGTGTTFDYAIPVGASDIFASVQLNEYMGDAWVHLGGTTRPRTAEGETYARFTNRQGLRAPAPVPKTGQTVSVGPADDGYWQMGQAWPEPRFVDKGQGTVTDNLTGLIWLKDSRCLTRHYWWDALSECNSLSNGDCGLFDGSSPGDWRMPNIKELLSLIDYSNAEPALPTAHLFTGVMNNLYWSSTSVTTDVVEGAAWTLDIWYGLTFPIFTDSVADVWPVRGGND
jgi:hypothetical protein